VDIRINEVHSQVQAVDSKSLLDPQVLRQIVKACVQAVKEEQERHKMLSDERRITSGVSVDDK
jgi:hypothetical protein